MTRPEDLSATGDTAPPVVPDVPLEAPEADVLEQAADAAPAPHLVERDIALEVPEADAVEQAQVVPLDDEDRPV